MGLMQIIHPDPQFEAVGIFHASQIILLHAGQFHHASGITCGSQPDPAFGFQFQVPCIDLGRGLQILRFTGAAQTNSLGGFNPFDTGLFPFISGTYIAESYG